MTKASRRLEATRRRRAQRRQKERERRGQITRPEPEVGTDGTTVEAVQLDPKELEDKMSYLEDIGCCNRCCLRYLEKKKFEDFRSCDDSTNQVSHLFISLSLRGYEPGASFRWRILTRIIDG